MEIRLIKGKLKSISFRNWGGIPDFALPISGSHVQPSCGEGMARGMGQHAVHQFISGPLQ